MFIGIVLDWFFSSLSVTTGWVYYGRVVPCFPSITQCIWVHRESGWEARIPEFKIKDVNHLPDFAVIDDRGELVGWSPVLP
jgi:uncharacterized membrane protein